jgi:hypothetical protein
MKPSCKRLLRSTTVLVMLGLALIAAAQPAAAAVSSVTLANPGPGTYGEDDDYFTRVWGNPRDMEQASDLYLLYSACNPTQIRRFSGESIANGMWSATTTPRAGDGTDNRDVYVLNPGWGSSLNVGEDGQLHPIDAGHYTQLTFRFYASQDVFHYGNVVFTKGEIGSMSGAVPFKIYAGWNVYTIDLRQRSGASWSGGITGLWFNLTDVPSGVTLRLDWLRLTPKAARQIRWTGSGSGSVSVYVGSNPGDANARSRLRISEGAPEAKDIVFGDSPLTVPASFPGDTYRAGVDDGGGVVSSSGAWTFKTVPIAQIVSPSYSSGDDWATTVAGNAWDMAGTDDVSAADSENVKYSVSNGVLTVTNISDGRSACDPNWPHRPLGLNLHDLAIESNRYKYLSFRYRVDQAPNQGPGTVTRARWLDDIIWAAGRTDDISLYNNSWTVYKLDLSSVPLEVEGAPWASQPYNVLQILVNEGHAAWTSHVDWVKLTAENQARGSYVVGWETVQGQATMATLYWDTDQNPGNGFASRAYRAAAAAAPAPSASHLVYLPVIMRNLGAAEHSFGLSTEDLAVGQRYYVALKLEDGYNTVYWYSELPVRKIP